MNLFERIARLERAAEAQTIGSEQIAASADALLARLQARVAAAPLEPMSVEQLAASKASLLALLKGTMQENRHAPK